MAAVLEEKTFRSLREVAVLVFFAGSLFFLISLFTYSNEDAGWTHSGTAQTVTNAGGVVGAWLADFCFSFFGVVAFVLPFVIIRHAYFVYILGKENRRKTSLILHWLGSLIAIVTSAALFYLHILRIGVELPGNTGGIIGQEVGDSLLLMCGNSGATLFLIASFLAGITLATQLSWLTILDLIGKYSVLLIDVVGNSVLRFWEMVSNSPRPAVVAGFAQPEAETYFKAAYVPPTSTTTTSSAPTTSPSASPAKKPVPEVKLPTLPSSIFSPVEKVAKEPQKQPRPTHSPTTNGEVLPSLALLDNRDTRVKGYTQSDLEEMSRLVEDILADFNVSVEVVGFLPGPVITRFELLPAAGVKVSRISSLSKDLARALSVTSVRIVEVIPGKSVIGLEIPNREREMVTLRELLASRSFEKSTSLLTLAMGKDISGQPLMADLGKMPHALVAGTTGSGKSVGINSMILSLLYKATPEQVRMIMIDPKMLELSVYEGIPHLLTPVVTDMKEAQNALRWAVGEMERRYKLMSKMGVRNLAGFNQMVEDAAASGKTIRDPMFQMLNPLTEGEEFPTLETLPSIVIVIDELADMMMIVGKKVEELIARLAQKARAAGIHLVLATQRPSVDVLTGLIKANIPTRISFQVSSRIDSRTILDQGGAEALLGNGDMLFLPSGTSIPIRAHGAFVDDNEVHRVVEFLKQTAPPNYLNEITQESFENSDGFGTSGGGYSSDPESDSLYDQAVEFVTQSRKASISSIQRRFKVGYNRAATMIEDMEAAGVVSPAETNGTRMVLAPSPVRD
ncbi:DNA translocase FtsK 4TM domain-containing protein [Methyloglobulus sp.]|uniref:DNA translocase FtsK n=1 Tax=Methyloglobulus sp. TaxID=2518622 RepID=UPI0032B80D08